MSQIPIEANNEPTAVIVANSEFFPRWFLRGYGAGFRNAGIHGGVVAPDGRMLREYAESEGMSVYPLGIPRTIRPLRDCVAVLKLAMYLRKVRPSVVHAHTPKGGIIGMLAAWLAQVPGRIYHLHGIPLTTASGPLRYVLWTVERLTCLLAKRVICVSPSIERLAVKAKLGPEQKFATVLSSSGVDCIHFSRERLGASAPLALRRAWGLPVGAFVVGFVGRLGVEKGLAELYDAWSVLRERHPALRLLIVGGKDERAPLSAELYLRLERDERVLLLGPVSDTAPAYSVMNLLVLPSHREGFGQVIAEASSMELPVVATRIPGCSDAVREGVTGSLVDLGDVEGLVAVMERYVGDPELCRSHGKQGRHFVETCLSPETRIKSIITHYQPFLPPATGYRYSY